MSLQEQVPYVPKKPIDSEPAPFELLGGTADIEGGTQVTVPINLALDSVQIRLDTGEFHVKYRAGIRGIGSIASHHHGKLSSDLAYQLLSHLRSTVHNTYV